VGATILRSDVFRCRQTIVVGPHPCVARWVHCHKPLLYLVLRRIIGGSLHAGPMKGGQPVVQAMKRTAKLTIPEILCGASCAVSSDGCVFVMVVRFTPSEVASGIWTMMSYALPFLIITLLPNNTTPRWMQLLRSRELGTQKEGIETAVAVATLMMPISCPVALYRHSSVKVKCLPPPK